MSSKNKIHTKCTRLCWLMPTYSVLDLWLRGAAYSPIFSSDCQCLHVHNRSYNGLADTVFCRLHVCCLGAGPGSEILGLHQLLPPCTEWLLLDNCEQWAHTAQILLQDVSDIPFRYGAFDICSNQGRGSRRNLTPNYAFKKVTSACCQFQLICACTTVYHAS